MSIVRDQTYQHCVSLQKKLIAGGVDENHFQLLVELVGVRNEGMTLALKEVLVEGKARKLACGEYKVSQACLSIKIKKMQLISNLISGAYIYYV